ncbi:uncharacterized protein LOC107032311 [Solanum pennellii]|uniref:Uncharacterized protein LOC107032311 n=1 Tax=Solanum pennellii TaxID=28526 RepID=A0ABM1UWI6_SOLPN|nr:uncharacterized protein LOC107032311 [Solanum pennellii]
MSASICYRSIRKHALFFTLPLCFSERKRKWKEELDEVLHRRGGPNGFSFVVWKVNKYVEDGLMYVAQNFVATSPASYSKSKLRDLWCRIVVLKVTFILLEV